VNRFNGKIWVEDSDLGGAAFIFTIPIHGTAASH